MNQAIKMSISQPMLRERLALIVLTTIYLVVFNRTMPHSDALWIVRQIENHHLIWNPNHLFFDPLGYGWYLFLEKLGFSISALDSFEIISGLSTILSLLIFHALLVQLGVRWWVMRAIAVTGLFASRSFLSMAVSQYYFMVQMPFLLSVFYLAVISLLKQRQGKECSICLYGMGILAGVAALLMFNNVLLVISLGLAIGFMQRDRISWNYKNVLRFWAAAAVVGFPLFIFGYFASGRNEDFILWLLSYQGDSTGTRNELWGLQWSLKGVSESFARLGFNLFSASIIENAGLGTVAKVILFREEMEFIPEIIKQSLALALTPVVAGTLFVLLLWAIRRFKQDQVVQLSVAWIGAYLIFNFLWSVGGDMFWFQIVPVAWLLLMINLGAVSGELFERSTENWGRGRWKLWVLALTVSALLIVNTLQTVVPVSLVDIKSRNAEHEALLLDGDLEIIPGWDGLGWMQLNPDGPRIERLTLMNMALLSKADEKHIARLPQIVASRLARGQRVVVARLYDKDYGLNPWSGLAKLGWSRGRIQSVLSDYCNKEIGRVDDVIFREVFYCSRGE